MAGGEGCVAPMKATSQGAYQGENPLDFALPLAILQICLVVVVTRGLAYLLRPLRQPRVIAEIIVSLILPLTSPGSARRVLFSPSLPVGNSRLRMWRWFFAWIHWVLALVAVAQRRAVRGFVRRKLIRRLSIVTDEIHKDEKGRTVQNKTEEEMP
jgi:hypothetical protein